MKDREWRYLTVPSSWKGHRTWQDHPTLGTYTGYAWYRCFVRLPAEWAGERCRIYLGYVSEADHTYLNGELVGRTGELDRATGDRATGDRTPATSEYDIDPGIVRCGEWNVVAVRVHHSGLEDSGGGLVGVQYGMSDFLYRDYRAQAAEGAAGDGATTPPSPSPQGAPEGERRVDYDRGRWLGEPGGEPCISCSRGALSLAGQWQFRRGDDERWAMPAESGRGAAAAAAAEYLSRARSPIGDPTPLHSGEAPAPAEQMSLWYRQPATDWCEALPIGNGRLGAMVHGGVGHERIQLNEESIWAGRPEARDRSAAHAAFLAARDALLEGNHAKAHRLMDRQFLAPNPVRSYQTAGVLHCQVGVGHAVADYRRELDLTRAVARTTYRDQDRVVQCEAFASAVDDVLVVRYRSDRPGTLDVRLWLDRIDPGTDAPARGTETAVEAGMLIQRGQAVHTLEQKDAWGAATPLRPLDQSPGTAFEVRLHAAAEGGSRTEADGAIVFESAESVLLLVAVETSAGDQDPAARAAVALEKASAMSYEELKRRHVADHRQYFLRLQLSLGPRSSQPTDELLRSAREGALDPSLVALLFQYGRYLMLASSRPGCLPTNNSALWNPYLTAQWDSDFHLDMDLQLRYWAVEVGNLGECHEALINFVDKLRPSGRETAAQLYGCRGFTTHCITDGHLYTDAVGGLWYGPFPASTAWLCWHLWEHYRYSQDREYLDEKAWPVMREAALFFLDFMVPHPDSGDLVAGPSVSPENHYITQKGLEASRGGDSGSGLDRLLGRSPDYETIGRLIRRGLVGTLDMGPAMDQQLIGNLFENCLAAAEALGLQDPILDQIAGARERLASGHRIGANGRLLEWSQEYGELEPGHRHISHLWDLYPGEQIDPDRTPDLASAARLVLQRRWEASRSLGQTGWSSIWNSLFWSRLRAPDRAWANFEELFRIGLLPNLFSTEPPVLVDGTFGCGAAVAEMLLQSHNDTIRLLPSLPQALGAGSVSGLRARGGFELALEWADGSLGSATVTSLRGNRCRILPGTRVTVECDGASVPVDWEGDVVVFDTQSARSYRLSPEPGRSPRVAAR